MTAQVAGTSTGGICRVGYDVHVIEDGAVFPRDYSVSDNPPAGSVTLRKTCPGAVFGTLSTEIGGVESAGALVTLDMRATCAGTGGLVDPCTAGQAVFASPATFYFQQGPAPFGVRTVTMIWPGLKRGLWRFEALPGGSSPNFLQRRTFTVQAAIGG